MLNLEREPSRLDAAFSSELVHVEETCRAVRGLLADHRLSPLSFACDLVLRELLNNAVLHGNRNNPELAVECLVLITDRALVLEVADQGEGFAWRERFPPPDGESLCVNEQGELLTSSYGMRILADYADEVIFNDKGNKVAVRIDKHLREGALMSTVHKEGQRAVLRPSGNIVAAHMESLRTELKQLLAEGVLELSVDLGEVKMIDSMGLGVLISAHNSLKKAGGSFAVINASKDLYDLFRSMRLTQHFSVTAA